MSCGVGQRCSSNPALLWLWRRPATTAPIHPGAWEPRYAIGAAPKREKKKKGKKRKETICSYMKMYYVKQESDHPMISQTQLLVQYEGHSLYNIKLVQDNIVHFGKT